MLVVSADWEKTSGLKFSVLCDTLLSRLQGVINSERKRTYEEMKLLAVRLTTMGVSAAGMELSENKA